MKFLYAVLAVFSVAAGGDFNDKDTATVEIWIKHDLGYVVDTVREITWQQSGNKWYLRTTRGDAWSDIPPRSVRDTTK